MQGWGSPADWLRIDMGIARTAIAGLRSGVANVGTPAGKQDFINNLGAIARAMDGVLQTRNNDPGIKEVHDRMTPIVLNTAQDINAGQVDATNLNENITKIEELVNEIARKANVGGRRKTRKGKKGKKRMSRRR
jgi:hypothetical protein